MAERQSRAGRHPVDVHVGQRIRARRRIIGVSQSTVAAALGVTFQQVQKYEIASNRVSASALFEIAQVLRVAPGYFFDGLERDDGVLAGDGPAGGRGASETIDRLVNAPGGLEMAGAYADLDPDRRSALLNVGKVLAEVSAGRRQLEAAL